MTTDYTPLCPLPNIGPCVEERCNFWDPEEGCLGVGVCFGADRSLDQTNFSGDENAE
ncbi:MAG: hypothetical protein HY743_08230 [Deltaproteobacteria bacterium]|nr:hypothetical protein [Deltaproteobacteria bacterium]